MECPPFLFDQFAHTRGVSALMAKRALMLQGYAEEGKGSWDCARSLKISEETVKLLCRRFMIDLKDYRPYERLERAGKPRPEPFVRKEAPAHELPLFGVA